MKNFLTVLIMGSLVAACSGRLKENQFLVENLMKKHPRKFKRAIKGKDTLGIKILYTQINRDSVNAPHFRSFYFNVDSTTYFYPASTVKLPIALLALEKINRLNVAGLDKHTPMFNDSVYSGQLFAREDSTSENGLPSVAHYIKKILLVSDNDAANRLYEFLGQKETNESLKNKGYNIRILHRLDRPLTPDQNRHTEAVRFVQHDSLVYGQPMLVNPDSIRPPRKVLKGYAYVTNDNKFVRKPFDFTYKNSNPLQDQQEVLKAVFFPQSTNPKKIFNLTEEDRQLVMRYMSQWPRETKYPAYFKNSIYTDAYVKYLMFAERKKPIPPHIRIFNKIGCAYGFLIDNAYIVDFKNKVEFMLSAVINTNTDGIYNDGKYEEHKIGFPFLRNLGKVVYRYELKRKRKIVPDLSSVKIKYE